MKRISTLNRVLDLFGVGKDGFRNGNKASGIDPTEFDADWCNSIQEELAAFPESLGVALNPANRGQVLSAVNAMIEARVGDFALDTGTANAKVIALNPAITAYTGNFGGSFKNAVLNTGAVTINAGVGAVALVNNAGAALVAGDLPAGAIVTYQYIHADTRAYVTSLVTSQAMSQAQADARYLQVLHNYLTGLTLSTAGASATMTVAAGKATDSANAVLMSLASAISKTTAAWAVGTAQGGLDTGAIANSTWYYWYLIRRPDTGAVDVLFSTNSTTPTLPANYTQYRYIGAGITNASAQWVLFTQTGDRFEWASPVLDFTGAGAASRSTLTISTPLGRKVVAMLNLSVLGGAAGAQGMYVSDLASTDLAPSQTVSPLAQAYYSGAAGGTAVTAAEVVTNVLGQIGHREINTNNVYIATKGWVDTRGRM